ncbi:DUF4012 domain-containing protein [Arthrobacter sp. AK04]|uniref:DUF4012 domain-containing protein n=1 Tax=Arthrobacter sp. AK04 TaxID=2900048 RepID=UPI001E294FDB|nr:DUF4012 domain-containing protein [Arthrobacter sp. AK04]MCD5343537.1 DUF4012 domain-containing protein [Arthrobacter sp. AK04]
MRKIRRRRPFLTVLTCVAAFFIIMGSGFAWLAVKASTITKELDAAAQLIPVLKNDLANSKPDEATAAVERLRVHTAAAKAAADDPLWTLASSVPVLGPNFSAVAEVARSADDVASIGLTPLVKVFASLDWDTVLPSSNGTGLGPLQAASPSVSSAARTVRLSAERLNQIDESNLMPQVAEPLAHARSQLAQVTGTLDSAAATAEVLPAMLGGDTPRSYLLMIQNNAESRASGGIPGALAILNFDQGKLTLGAQSSASSLGTMSPTLPLDAEQQQIYSGRLGKFMQDVNLTPDFPSAARIAQKMWETKTGQRVDGVLSIDPVVLGYILSATGPVAIADPALAAVVTDVGLPVEMNGTNVVHTLLSDVYAKIEEPAMQDAYFAGVAKEIFNALSDGEADAKGLISGLTRGTDEGRVLMWSARNKEQGVLLSYPLSGSISGPAVQPAQFGVYFNDGTGAKMDYYVKRTVQLVKECPRDGYQETTVRVTSTNTASPDAARALPEYVTGGGVYGVPPGSVRTNIAVYGPVQANVETVKLDGAKAEFAPYLHSNRPVGVFAVQLAPGESKTLDFTFSKIVQHTEPNVFVTPTVQDVKDVTLPTENATCS